ncbi:proteasome subunit beta [archaeon]|nr:proteasome subunit beta [archaeon]
MENKETLKTGTTTVGLVCKEGVVLAADKRASLGGRIVAHKKMDKVVKINDDIAVTTAGSVSDIQLFIKLIKANLNLNFMKIGKKSTVKEVVNLFGGMIYGSARQFFPAMTSFLLGGRDNEGAYLYDIGMDGSVMEYKDYTCTGSGMLFATGSLESNYKEGMNLQECIRTAIKAVNAAMQRDTASGNGIDVFVITKKDGVKKVFEKEVDSIITY